MTQDESEASSKQTLSAIFAELERQRSDLRELVLWMKEMWLSPVPADCTSSSSKHDEILKRLSTLEVGLKKLIERQDSTEKLAIWQMTHNPFSSSSIPASQSAKRS